MSLRTVVRVAIVAAACTVMASAPQAQAPSTVTAASAAIHARQVRRLLITHAMVIPGPAVPAAGPMDILVEDGVIARMGTNAGRWPAADLTIDATGKY